MVSEDISVLGWIWESIFVELLNLLGFYELSEYLLLHIYFMLLTQKEMRVVPASLG